MRQSFLSPGITAVLIFSLIYWSYLASSTQMQIIYDAQNYQELGSLLHNQGFVAYFKTGPNREPLYPLLVAASMYCEQITGLAYVKIMAIFGVILLFLTQLLTYKILRLLNVRIGICMLMLAYIALSPALNNAAFSLFSEIVQIPIILGIILSSACAWKAISENNRQQAFLYGALLGLLLTAATLAKAVFECIAPAYLIIVFMVIFLSDKTKKIATLLLCLVVTISFYFIPITDYKWLNKLYNNNFAITGRASWTLYGATARRMEPLTPQRLKEALAYVPGEGVCNGLYGREECHFWSLQKADEYGYAKLNELSSQHLSLKLMNGPLIRLSAQKALANPFQYALLTFIEYLKMFFWESTKVGFVNYPSWLEKIYDNKSFNNGLRFFAAWATLLAVISLWFGALRPQRSPLSFIMGVLIFLYILVFSFFFILTRYLIPIVPLYLIAIGLWIEQILKPKNTI